MPGILPNHSSLKLTVESGQDGGLGLGYCCFMYASYCSNPLPKPHSKIMSNDAFVNIS